MLPKAVRARKHFEVGRFIEDRAGERSEEVVALLAEHYGRAAALASEARLDPGERTPIDERALQFMEAAGDAAASFYSNREAVANFRAARELSGDQEAARARIGEKEGDVALRLGRVDAAIEVWEECLEFHRREEDLERVAGLHRKIGAALWHRGERKPAIEHHQQGINLLRSELSGDQEAARARIGEKEGDVALRLGRVDAAIEVWEECLEFHRREEDLERVAGLHRKIGAALWHRGERKPAIEHHQQGINLL